MKFCILQELQLKIWMKNIHRFVSDLCIDIKTRWNFDVIRKIPLTIPMLKKDIQVALMNMYMSIMFIKPCWNLFLGWEYHYHPSCQYTIGTCPKTEAKTSGKEEGKEGVDSKSKCFPSNKINVSEVVVDSKAVSFEHDSTCMLNELLPLHSAQTNVPSLHVSSQRGSAVRWMYSQVGEF